MNKENNAVEHDKVSISLRLFPDQEEDRYLYHKIQQGRADGHLSMAYYVRKVLLDSFRFMDKRQEEESFLRHLTELAETMSHQIVDTVQQEMQIHDNRLTMAIGRMGAGNVMEDTEQKVEHVEITNRTADRTLPEESDSLPEEVGNVLDMFE
jgi:hypothetical protein